MSAARVVISVEGDALCYLSDLVAGMGIFVCMLLCGLDLYELVTGVADARTFAKNMAYDVAGSLSIILLGVVVRLLVLGR